MCVLTFTESVRMWHIGYWLNVIRSKEDLRIDLFPSLVYIGRSARPLCDILSRKAEFRQQFGKGLERKGKGKGEKKEEGEQRGTLLPDLYLRS